MDVPPFQLGRVDFSATCSQEIREQLNAIIKDE